MRRRFILTAILMASPVAAAIAQGAPLVTDRPDFTESSTLVPRGKIQFESGITFSESSRNSGAARSTTYPELLVRYGLTSHIELRAAQSYVRFSAPTPFGGAFTAREDLYLGVKLGLGAQRGARPELAFMVQSTFATGDDRISESIHPGVALLAGWELSPAWSLGMGVQANSAGGDAYEVAPSVVVGRALGSKLKGYAELFSFVPVLSESGAPTPHYVNGGLSLLISSKAQLDARIGAGLNDSADRYFVGFGFAIRP